MNPTEQQVFDLAAARAARKIARELAGSDVTVVRTAERRQKQRARDELSDRMKDPEYRRMRKARIRERQVEREKAKRDTAAERRAAELAKIERVMRASPGASAAHRGTKSLHPTAAPGAAARIADEPQERITDGRRHPVMSTKKPT